MVTKIISGKSIRGLLNYNEHKVTEGDAELIMASLFGTELDKLSFNAKLERFENLTKLSPQVRTNALHIMLNFDTSEKLDHTTLQKIADTYMGKIGLGDQPYLVYLHKDVSHQHLHIVTTTIQPDGKPINIHNIGKALSEPARKEIERKFRLVPAESKQRERVDAIKAIDPEKAQYGRTPTKRAISNVVSAVVRSYKFTSLAELNAVLSQYNVVADRGKEDTDMYKHRGLVYSIIDAEGNRIGIPFKASVLPYKPTLDHLEKKFERNAEKRNLHKDDFKQRIDKVMDGYTQFTKATFISELAKQGIHAVFRQNEQGRIYGITYVDNSHKTVFNGSDLGKVYTAKAITEKLAHADMAVTTKQGQQRGKETDSKKQGQRQQQKTYLRPAVTPTNYLQTVLAKHQPPKQKVDDGKGLLDIALAKTAPDYAPAIPKRKKKRRKGFRFSG
ncbi:mobilization protein [Parapedobacter defluvii]|uniref:Mobilization protein n=1 Tax=Parapedobacter defluvii TaxID=2045106 RepID=A0ABQ1M5W1_9SPHI|nr:relaxase/mobilization nuclease domain-containing protein [Parapedobacter defluvii]GGC33264.1 mobilization protein [Parapedobacter defluvii]